MTHKIERSYNIYIVRKQCPEHFGVESKLVCIYEEDVGVVMVERPFDQAISRNMD